MFRVKYSAPEFITQHYFANRNSPPCRYALRAAVIEVDGGESQIQQIERYEMIFIKIVCGVGRRKVQRTEIDFLPAVLRLVNKRQSLRSAYERARGIYCASIIHKQRAIYILAALLPLQDFFGLGFDRRVQIGRQSFNRCADCGSFYGKDRYVMQAARAASGAADKMSGVMRREARREAIGCAQ